MVLGSQLMSKSPGSTPDSTRPNPEGGVFYMLHIVYTILQDIRTEQQPILPVPLLSLLLHSPRSFVLFFFFFLSGVFLAVVFWLQRFPWIVACGVSSL